MKSFKSAATLAVVAASCLLTAASTARAQNVALGKPVIDSSGSYQFLAGFEASKVTDGSASDVFQGTYWLGREATPQEYFTIDLGSNFHIDQVSLRNTHNAQFNDRGTGEFVLFGATAVDASNHLINPFPLLASALSPVDNQSPITPQVYTSANGLTPATARFLRFETITSAYVTNNVGLNEIEVYDLSSVNNNLAFGKPVIESSGSYPLPGFEASKVTDGSISDSFQVNYWLGREGVPQEHFTVDLGAVKHIEEILLRNAHNDVHGDRATGEFRILVGNTVDANNQLVGGTQILQGRLTNTAGQTVITPDVFTSANGLTIADARYVRFEALNSAYSDTNNIALNEIEIYADEQHAPTVYRNNVAFGKPVIKETGSYGAPNPSPYPASRVTDGSSADSNGARSSYWLGREMQDGESFTLDLQGIYHVDEIDLRNTHNKIYNDRGTGEFFILGATAVDGNNELIQPELILAGQLTNTGGTTIIPADVFTAANGLIPMNVRYLQFTAVTKVPPVNGFGGVGLNEIEVYGTLVPEPSTVLLLGVAGVVLGWRRMRRG
jgi:hypothetical protein